LAILLLTGVAVSAQQVFYSSLSGAQEVPANASTAKGTCKITLNAAETQVSVSCTYSGLSSNLTAGHTHGAAAIGVNAGVLLNYAPPTGNTSGSFNAGPFNVTAQNVADMRAHRHYTNLHTTNFPGGEIRGQIKQANTPMDMDGDGRTDAAVYRQSSTQYWTLGSLTGAVSIINMGQAAAENHLNNTWDFDGDGLADRLLLRLDGSSLANWTILQSSTNTTRTELWGDFSAASGDTLAPADYDGDGKQDVAVYRRSTGTWWVIRSTDNARTATRWGAVVAAASGDFPSIGDYDGDGRADLTVVRVESGARVWYTLRSSDGAERRTVFGASATDGVFFFAPVDFDGDGKQDIFVNRSVSSQRQFHILRSSDGGYTVATWGTTAVPASVAQFGDYDGDGKTDLIARRTNGTNFVFEILRSSDNAIQYITWGLPTDQLMGGSYPNDFNWNQNLEMSNDQRSDVMFSSK